MEAMCEELLFINFSAYLNESHCKLLFLSLETTVTTDKLKPSFIWNESENSAQQNAEQWFIEFVDGASETYLKKKIEI